MRAAAWILYATQYCAVDTVLDGRRFALFTGRKCDSRFLAAILASSAIMSAALHTIRTMAGGQQNESSGTGSGFGRIVLILAGVSAIVACLLTVM